MVIAHLTPTVNQLLCLHFSMQEIKTAIIEDARQKSSSKDGITLIIDQ
jgi:hypothetical protein